VAESIFTLEALEAAEGDALLLHYGSRQKPRLIVIDGGPKDIYKKSLAPRLAQIRQARGGGVMEVRMVMVSHIDGDHITGILDLTRDLRKTQDGNEELPYDILTLWHNSFDDIVAKLNAEIQEHVVRVKHTDLGADAAAIAADVPQGRTLRFDANALSLNLNSGFEDLVIFETKASGKNTVDANTMNIGEKLSFLILGPRRAEIDALEDKWATDVGKLLSKKSAVKKKVVKKKAKNAGGASIADVDALAEKVLLPAEFDAIAAAFVDKSIPNLSSIVVLASLHGKTMLLTGDARGDLILDSLEDCGLLPKDGGTMHVDLLKMPHHGSDRNMKQVFLERVTADHYVFSADGKNGNPDVATFQMLFAARPKGPYTLWITNDVAPATKFIRNNKPAKVEVKIRKDPARSLKIELGAPMQF
jgi:beta-lactamase superfamily II metal-dependent hydrolase